MIRVNPNLLKFDEFLAQYGDRDRYELIDGEVVDLEPTGLHEQVSRCNFCGGTIIIIFA